MDQGYVALDTRLRNDFLKCFVPGSISTDMVNLQFELWIGRLFAPSTKFIFICEVGKEEEIVIRFSRIGYDNVGGYLEGGIDSWVKDGK